LTNSLKIVIVFNMQMRISNCQMDQFDPAYSDLTSSWLTYYWIANHLAYSNYDQ